MSSRPFATLTALASAVLVSAMHGAPAVFPRPTNNQAITDLPLTSPQAALAGMHLPPGFKATLFAAEPEVQNPIAMCWDERGRLWIAENFTYSDNKERYDLKLRDRILIFEDTDNDGRFDQRTVFADDLQMLTSIERGFGGVYALCPPHLLWIPTTGDKPSGPPQILLDGFSTTAASRHTFANGLKWGPDGWLYGRSGISSTSWVDVPGTPREKRQPLSGGLWRYHPARRVFETWCHGTTNPWGSDWNEHGDVFFINTVIGHLWHGIQGAHFRRMHGEDAYPHVYGLIEQHADHFHWDTGEAWSDTKKIGVTPSTSSFGGGHAHVGLMIYQGTNFPPAYRGKVFTTNIHGRRVNVDRLERAGSGYVGKHEPDFMRMDDPWFRAVEIQAGPDGGVYILDWSDIGECHENDGVHRESGRIYKITYGDAVRPKETDLKKHSDTQLASLQSSDNEWLVRMARWELRERARKTGGLPALTAPLIVQFHAAPTSAKKLNAWWTLQQITAFAPDSAAALAPVRSALSASAEEYLQRWAVPFTPATAANTATPYLRLARATTLPSLPPADRVALARLLLAHAEDAADHNLPLMYWFGLRELAPAQLAPLFDPCRIPLVRQFIARRVGEDLESDPAPLNALLALAAGEPAADLVRGLSDALKGWSKARKPAAWDAFAARAAATLDEAGAKSLRDLEVLFGSGRVLDEVRAIALDPKAGPEHRRAALRTLIEAKAPDLRRVCESLIAVPGVSLEAIRGLALFSDFAAADRIIARYRNLPAHERPAALAVLASRPSFAAVLLNELGNPAARNPIPRTDLTPLLARQIRSFNDPALSQKLAEVWGEARESSADKAALIASLKTKLTPASIGAADASQGRAVFNRACASCHKLYGEGGALGPDLTGSGRHDLGYLIENIADPSAVVAADQVMHVVTLRDGRVLNGIITAQSDRTLTLKSTDHETAIARADIAKHEQLPISMMPEGLLTALPDHQVRDLIAYLMSATQVPLPQ
ncbi:MAG: c-type cytochrome [Opitutaceae bacterium]|nr:c-type cytochrome [Opitutaceae bacterium]